MTRIKLLAVCVVVFLGSVLAGLILALLFGTDPAQAACGSLPYVFVNNTSTVDANTTNANNNFLLGCATSVDNTQIGAAGIFASQIVPTGTATATFSSAYGWRITSSSNTATPLTIMQSSAPSVDTLAVYNNALSTKYLWVDSSGVLNLNQAPKVNGTPMPIAVATPGLTLSAGTIALAHGDYVDTTAAQTIGGIKTFSSQVIANNICTSTCPASQTNGDMNVQRPGQGVGVLDFGGTILHYIFYTGSGFTITDPVTAPSFFTSSKRSYKTDIHPLHIDGLQILEHTCWSTYHYREKWGDPAPEHIGFIADCAPDTLAGPYHDHYDIEAVSTVNAQAILQLAHRLDGLERMVLRLCAQPQNRKVRACRSKR